MSAAHRSKLEDLVELPRKMQRMKYSALEERIMWCFFARELRAGNEDALRRRPRIWELYERTEHTAKKMWGLESHFRKYMLPRIHHANVPKEDMFLLLRFFKVKLDQRQQEFLEQRFSCDVECNSDGSFVRAQLKFGQVKYTFPTAQEEETVRSAGHYDRSSDSDEECQRKQPLGSPNKQRESTSSAKAVYRVQERRKRHLDAALHSDGPIERGTPEPLPPINEGTGCSPKECAREEVDDDVLFLVEVQKSSASNELAVPPLKIAKYGGENAPQERRQSDSYEQNAGGCGPGEEKEGNEQERPMGRDECQAVEVPEYRQNRLERDSVEDQDLAKDQPGEEQEEIIIVDPSVSDNSEVLIPADGEEEEVRSRQRRGGPVEVAGENYQSGSGIPPLPSPLLQEQSDGYLP